MCHVFDSTLRLYAQTAHGRTVAGCSKSKPLQCCHRAAAAVCLSLGDGRRRADGWLINAGPLQFRATADG